jgi:hypothetical protein
VKPDPETRFPRPSQWLFLAIALGIGILVSGLYAVMMTVAERMRSQPL